MGIDQINSFVQELKPFSRRAKCASRADGASASHCDVLPRTARVDAPHRPIPPPPPRRQVPHGHEQPSEKNEPSSAARPSGARSGGQGRRGGAGEQDLMDVKAFIRIGKNLWDNIYQNHLTSKLCFEISVKTG